MKTKNNANLIFFLTVFMSIAASYFNNFLYQKTEDMSYIIISSQIVLILPSILYIWWKKNNVFEFIRTKKLSGSTIVLLILFSYLITPVMTFVNALSMLVFRNDTSATILEVVHDKGLLLSLILIAVIPAFFEEFVYRGVLYREYRDINMKKGILLSGFLFGIIHGNGNQFSYAFFMGIIFALVIEATDSILSTILIHFLINGTSVILGFVYPYLERVIESMSESSVTMAQDNLISQNQSIMDSSQQILENLNFSQIVQSFGLNALISGTLAFIVFRTIAKNNGRWEGLKNGLRHRERNGDNAYFTVPLILGVVICIGRMILNEI